MGIERARAKRKARANALERLRLGQLGTRTVLREGHNALGTCPIHVLLAAAPGIGPGKTKEILLEAGVWPLNRLCDLSRVQRAAILQKLPEYVQ